MSIQKITIVLLLSAGAMCRANQINMSNVRSVTQIKSETANYTDSEEPDLDIPIDFETEGEIDLNELKPFWVTIANKIVSPFFVLYNWFQQDN